jgi:hypothetical protein
MTDGPLKVLILGGYGTFGGRLAQLLADEAELTLIIAGRSRDKAQAFVRRCPPHAGLLPFRSFDRDGDERQLRGRPTWWSMRPGRSNPMARIPIAWCGGHRRRRPLSRSRRRLDFVDGVAQFDAEARARGIFVLAGVSSFPFSPPPSSGS